MHIVHLIFHSNAIMSSKKVPRVYVCEEKIPTRPCNRTLKVLISACEENDPSYIYMSFLIP